MKKYLSIILAAFLTVNVLSGCAGRSSSPEQKCSYAKLIVYKTENYSRQSVAEFIL